MLIQNWFDKEGIAARDLLAIEDQFNVFESRLYYMAFAAYLLFMSSLLYGFCCLFTIYVVTICN